MVKKKVTIEDLAGMVQGGFSEMQDKFSAMDDRFLAMEDQITAVKTELKNDLARLENIMMGNYERRLEKVEDNVRVLLTKVGIKNN